MRTLILLSCLFIICTFENLYAQTPFETLEDFHHYYDEIFTLEADGSRILNLLDRIEQLISNPIEINHSLEPLVALQLMKESDLEIIQNYKNKHGAFVSIYELQSIENLSPNVIYRIQALIKSDHTGAKESLIHKIKHSQQTIFMRWARILEEKQGYQKDSLGQSKYLGDANAFYIRYRGLYNKKLSFGITLEKDAGEQFYKQSSIFGFDHHSFHFQIQSPKSIFRKVIVGDYTYQMGQGLILNNGFSTGKGMNIGGIKISGNRLNAFTALSETAYFRGLASQLYLGKNLSASILLSKRNHDTSQDSAATFFSSLLASGLHRTASEINNKHNVQLFSVGGTVKFQSGRNYIAINSIYHRFSIPLVRSDDLYKRFLFQGQYLWNQSIDYSYIFKNLHLFGEFARDHQGHISYNHGIMMAWNKYLSFGFFLRNYHFKFQNLFANAFSESSAPQNEKGLYLSMEIKPVKNFTINSYLDFWKHPWYKFNIDGPSDGAEYILRFTYKKKRRLLLYAQYKHEVKSQNFKFEGQTLLRDRIKKQYRFHLAYHLERQVEFRTRLEVSNVNFNTVAESGYLVYQDFIYKPIGTNISFTSRIGYFDIPTFTSRIYAYENDILGSFSIPAYQGQGMRLYLNIRYRPINKVTLDLRIAQTYLYHTTSISSGPEGIDGNTKTQVKAQIKVKF